MVKSEKIAKTEHLGQKNTKVNSFMPKTNIILPHPNKKHAARRFFVWQ